MFSLGEQNKFQYVEKASFLTELLPESHLLMSSIVSRISGVITLLLCFLISPVEAQPNPSEIEIVPGYHYEGINGIIYDIISHDGDVYISGSFDSIGDKIIKWLARWDGSAWHAVGAGVTNHVSNFATFQGDLYAIRLYPDEDGSPFQEPGFGRISPDGIELITLPEGTQPGFTLFSHNGLLHAFLVTQPGGSPQSAHFTFDGENWEKASDDFLGVPHWAAAVGDTIYTAALSQLGSPNQPSVFSQLGKLTPGETEITLIDSVPHSIRGLKSFGGELYLHGTQVSTDQGPVLVFRRSGGNFHPVPMDNAFNFPSSVTTMLVFEDELYFAGTFRMNQNNEYHQLVKLNSNGGFIMPVQSQGTPSIFPRIIRSAAVVEDGILVAGSFIAGDLQSRDLVHFNSAMEPSPVFEPESGIPIPGVRRFYRTPNRILGQAAGFTLVLPDGSRTFVADLQTGEAEPISVAPLNSFVTDKATYFSASTSDGLSLFEINDEGYSAIVPHMPFTPLAIADEPDTHPVAMFRDNDTGLFRVRRFNGASWSRVGDDIVSGELIVLKRRNNKVIVGRQVQELADENDSALLSYDLAQGNFGDWVPYRGVQLTGYVSDLSFGEDNELIVAGDYYYDGSDVMHYVGSVSADGVFTDFSGSLNGLVRRVTLWNGLLVASGFFTENRHTGEPLHSLAAWQDGDWVQLLEGNEPGTLSGVGELFPIKNSLYLVGNFSTFGGIVSTQIARIDHPELPPVSITPEPEPVPGRVALHQNYPNPFNPTTQIRYVLPEAGQVRLNVYDLSGRHIMQLQNGHQPAGTHTVTFDGSRLSSGVYFYQLQTGDRVQNRAMTLIK